MEALTHSNLRVFNFGPIRDVCIEYKRFMVFIGSQGTGKSTLAKLWTIFNDTFWWLNVYNEDNPIAEFKVMGIDNYFKDDSELEYTNGVVNIKYHKGNFSISSDIADYDQLKIILREFVFSSIRNTASKLGVPEDKIEESLKERKNLALFRSNNHLLCYVPAERNMGVLMGSSLANLMLYNIPLSQRLLEYMALVERAQASMPEYDASFLGVKYIRKEGANILVDQKNGKYLRIDECSSGIQNALPLLMLLEYATNDQTFDNFVVEEPEQNLFPDNQRELLNRLVAITKRKKTSGMIINTHSPYLLSSLNICILAYKISQDKMLKDEVCKILPAEYHISTEDVGVYALNYSEEEYCHNLIDEKTGLIAGNFLDSASDVISSDFNILYKLFIKSLRK